MLKIPRYSFLLVIFLVFIATACTDSTSSPSLGDSLTRGSDGMIIVFVPGGTFEMGSDSTEVDFALDMCRAYDTNCQRWYFSVEEPVHTVTVDSYWIDQTEVTNGQYSLCVEAGICEETRCQEEREIGDDHPVVCVTWEQAAAYCEWAGGRLPTEAEWEYAARGVDRLRYPWGDEFDGSLLNYCDANCSLPKRDESIDDSYATTAPVGSYPGGASWVAALDMSGNVWEFTGDWLGEYPSDPQVNPLGPDSGARVVLRGGSWHTSPDHARSALRTYTQPQNTSDHGGFRCVQPVTGVE